MDDMQKPNGTGVPKEPVSDATIQTVHERTLVQITNSYGNLGMIKTDLEKLPITNARNQLIVELGGVLRGLQKAHDHAKDSMVKS